MAEEPGAKTSGPGCVSVIHGGTHLLDSIDGEDDFLSVSSECHRSSKVSKF